jgi:hypothetical protein
MTMISMVNGSGYPVIVSDRAISQKNTLGKVVLPTTNRETFFPTVVVDFKVKSLIIKDVLCVAFAGLVSEIERIHDEVTDFFMHRDINQQTFNDFLSQLQYNSDVSFLFALGGPEFDKNRVMVACTDDFMRDQSKDGLDILSFGTGREAWIDAFVKTEPYLEKIGINSIDSKLRALVACMRFMTFEQISTDILIDGWGGGFDIIYYAEGKFHRYDELAFNFLFIDKADPENIKNLALIHQNYENGNVIVRNIESKQNQLHIIRQFRDQDPLGPDNPVMVCKSNDVVTSILIREENRTVDALIIPAFDLRENPVPLFLAFQRPGENEFKIYPSPLYVETIMKALKLYLN